MPLVWIRVVSEVYTVPSMAEIAATPRNGLSVISTFTGCGGACLGYKWAGFDARAAVEFVSAARDTYALNFPGVPIDPRDVRDIGGQDLLALAGLDEVDLLEGSPPCASFSMSGKREEHWGESKHYSDTSQRTDDLFLEFARLVREIRPRAFAAENVAGLVRGTAKGMFKLFLRELAIDGDYRVEARLLDASWLGVPQARKRLFFVGLRNDVDGQMVWPKPILPRWTLRDALDYAASNERECPGDGPSLKGAAIEKSWQKMGPQLGGKWLTKSDKYINLVRPDPNQPCGTVTATGGQGSTASVTHPTEARKFTLAEMRAVFGFPADFQLTGTYRHRWERIGRSVPPPMTRALGLSIAEALA